MIQLLAWVLACIIGSLLGSLASVAHGGYEVAGHPVAVTWLRDHLTFTLDVGVLALAQALVLKWRFPHVTAAIYVVAAVFFSIGYGLFYPALLSLVSPPLAGAGLLAAMALPSGLLAALEWIALRDVATGIWRWVGACLLGAVLASVAASVATDELVFHGLYGLVFGLVSSAGLAGLSAKE